MAEGRRQLDEALARASTAGRPLRARGLSCLGALLIWTAGEVEGANRSIEVERAKVVLGEAAALARSLEDPLTLARSLTSLAMLGLTTKDWSQARRLLEEARASWQEAHHPWGVASTLLHLGTVELMQGNYQEAARLAEESAAHYCVLGDDSERAVALLVLMTATGARGEGARTAALVQELLALSDQAQNPPLTVACAAGVAWLVRDQADPERLARLLGAADAMHHATEFAGRAVIRLYGAAASEALQARIGQEAFNAALAKGRSLSFEQMLALLEQTLEKVLQLAAPRECAATRAQSTLLSPREQEVLQLVAHGLSNKGIAKEMIVAQSTVAYYLTSIYNKLGVDTRTHALAVAARRGLVTLGQEP